MDYKTGTGRRGDSVGQPAVGAGGGAAAAPAGGHAERPSNYCSGWLLPPPQALSQAVLGQCGARHPAHTTTLIVTLTWGQIITLHTLTASLITQL
ncbi:hypothetical protein E2C01_048791 [Portunus trituberculatus]|uniref:Uncharacterized protein n=1 Tax=Portunus trituberculatus TaxID=210409 RepID=A0A5B7GC15_PORTR|nr:hypothetical protein [Portunus trituberculatus]